MGEERWEMGARKLNLGTDKFCIGVGTDLLNLSSAALRGKPGVT